MKTRRTTRQQGVSSAELPNSPNECANIAALFRDPRAALCVDICDARVEPSDISWRQWLQLSRDLPQQGLRQFGGNGDVGNPILIDEELIDMQVGTCWPCEVDFFGSLKPDFQPNLLRSPATG